MIEQLLFESPWPVIFALLAVGLVFRILARQRGDRRLLIGTLVAVLLAAGVYGLATVVTTDRERVDQLTSELVMATEGGLDVTTLDQLLAVDAVLERHDGAPWLRWDEQRDLIQTLASRHTISEHQIRRTSVRLPERGLAQVDLLVSSTLQRQPDISVPTRWELTWQRRDEQWQLIRARWTEIRGQSPDRGVIQ